MFQRKWTDEQEQFIRENCGAMKDKDLSSHLSILAGRPVSIQAVRKMRKRLGISKGHGRGRCIITARPPEPFVGFAIIQSP